VWRRLLLNALVRGLAHDRAIVRPLYALSVFLGTRSDLGVIDVSSTASAARWPGVGEPAPAPDRYVVTTRPPCSRAAVIFVAYFLSDDRAAHRPADRRHSCPALGALVILLAGCRAPRRGVPGWTAGQPATFAVSLPLWARFDAGDADMPVREFLRWMPGWVSATTSASTASACSSCFSPRSSCRWRSPRLARDRGPDEGVHDRHAPAWRRAWWRFVSLDLFLFLYSGRLC